MKKFYQKMYLIKTWFILFFWDCLVCIVDRKQSWYSLREQSFYVVQYCKNGFDKINAKEALKKLTIDECYGVISSMCEEIVNPK